MGDINDKLDYLETTKSLIKQAIQNKGVTVSDTDTFRSYATKIAEIKSGDSAQSLIRDFIVEDDSIQEYAMKYMSDTGFVITDQNRYETLGAVRTGSYSNCIQIKDAPAAEGSEGTYFNQQITLECEVNATQTYGFFIYGAYSVQNYGGNFRFEVVSNAGTTANAQEVEVPIVLGHRYIISIKPNNSNTVTVQDITAGTGVQTICSDISTLTQGWEAMADRPYVIGAQLSNPDSNRNVSYYNDLTIHSVTQNTTVNNYTYTPVEDYKTGGYYGLKCNETNEFFGGEEVNNTLDRTYGITSANWTEEE